MTRDLVQAGAANDAVRLKSFDELDRVTTLEPVSTEAGTLAAGSSGTIVAVWNGGEAYDVEFIRPVGALVTLTRSQVRSIGPQ